MTRHEPALGIYSGDQQERLYRIVDERGDLDGDERRYHDHESNRWQMDCLWCQADMELTAREQAARIDWAWRKVFTARDRIDPALAEQLLDVLVGQWESGKQVPGSGRKRIEEMLP